MNTLLLVQHCQSHQHLLAEAKSWPDARNGLTDLGRQQARRVAERLAREYAGTTVRLISSPMQRARETASDIGKSLATKAEIVWGLHEYNGRFPMERDSDAAPWNIDMSNWSLFDWRPVPEAESWREFHSRVSAAMEGVSARLPDDTMPIVVSHGGTGSNIVAWWLALPLDVLPERTCFTGAPGSLTLLLRNKHGRPSIGRLNDCAHLTGVESEGGAVGLGRVRPDFS